jgi:DNA-directed RNA polymerase subunit RPC12/RpoP
MTSKKQYLRSLNEIVKWGSDGFFHESRPCSTFDINNSLLGVEEDTGHRFKPGFIDASSDDDEDSASSSSDDENDAGSSEELDDGKKNEDDSDDSEDVDSNEISTMKQPILYSCSICGMQFVLMTRLSSHMSMNHPRKTPKHRQSTESVKTISELRSTSQQPYIIKPRSREELSCSICERSFSNRSNLTRHRISQHNAKKFNCSKCNREFGRIDNMKEHNRVCKITPENA